MQGNLLKAKIYEKGYKIQDLKAILKKSLNAIYMKIKGKTPFTNDEIKEIKNFLNLTDEEVTTIFLN